MGTPGDPAAGRVALEITRGARTSPRSSFYAEVTTKGGCGVSMASGGWGSGSHVQADRGFHKRGAGERLPPQQAASLVSISGPHRGGKGGKGGRREGGGRREWVWVWWVREHVQWA
jgi:hypothetical protein